jgi:hypothetical protein
MKLSISLFALAMCFLFLSSCNKGNTDSPYANDSIPKIQSVTEYFNGAEQRVTSFSYDSSARIVKILFNEIYEAQQYYDTVIYSGSTIKLITYNNNKKFLEQEVFTLNSNKLAVIMIDTLGDNKKSARMNFTTLNLLEHEANIYGYDGNGYQTLELSTNEYGGTHRYDKTYSNGNLVSSTYQFMANDTAIQNGTTAFSYYEGKTNTIGNQNRGIPFLGKQNTNLLLSISDLKWHTTDTLRVITTYRYEFDDHNRVARQYITTQGNENNDVTFLTYTYR